MTSSPNSQVLGVIPARMGSSRFPGKPLAPILGMPMIGHCLLRSAMATSLDDIVVATPDREIAEYVTKIGGTAIITSDDHPTASDRTAEAVQVIDEESGRQFEMVVMIQGDEPLVRPEMIDEAVSAMRSTGCSVANLCAPISASESLDPNEIKVVMDEQNRARYMSRSAIPHDRDGTAPDRFKQVCVIPFTRDFLFEFNRLTRTPLELAESIDMLRAIEHGYEVAMVPVEKPMKSVDTPEDLKDAEVLLGDDDLVHHYM